MRSTTGRPCYVVSYAFWFAVINFAHFILIILHYASISKMSIKLKTIPRWSRQQWVASSRCFVKSRDGFVDTGKPVCYRSLTEFYSIWVLFSARQIGYSKKCSRHARELEKIWQSNDRSLILRKLLNAKLFWASQESPQNFYGTCARGIYLFQTFQRGHHPFSNRKMTLHNTETCKQSLPTSLRVKAKPVSSMWWAGKW